jgi:hypothetical protein
MIAELLKVLDALRAGWSAGRAVMEGRHPVLVDEVLAAEDCECPVPRVVVVHERGTPCGEAQRKFLVVSLGDGDDAELCVPEALNALRDEADRRDGVIR